ncbi:hypothetical protein QTN25_005600 [Entamoeba marina]
MWCFFCFCICFTSSFALFDELDDFYDLDTFAEDVSNEWDIDYYDDDDYNDSDYFDHALDTTDDDIDINDYKNAEKISRNQLKERVVEKAKLKAKEIARMIKNKARHKIHRLLNDLTPFQKFPIP